MDSRQRRFCYANLWLGVLTTMGALLLGKAQARDNHPVCDAAFESSAVETVSHANHQSADRCAVNREGEPEPPHLAAESAKGSLPVLELPRGWTINQALLMPDWLTLNASVLSQNNGALSGLQNPQFTSSNLFNLGFRIGPVMGSKGKVNMGTTAPEQGVDYGEHFHNKIAINGLLTQRTGQILSSYIPNQLNTQWNFGNGPVGRLGFLNLEYKSEGDFISMVKIGKLMQAQDFTMNPVQCYFSNFGFCGWAQGVPAMIDIPGNPFNSYGAVVAFGDSQSINFRYGIYQVAPATFAPDLHGLDFSFNQGIGIAHFAELRLPININPRIPINYNKQSRSAFASDWKDASMVYQSLLPPGTFTLGGWLGYGSFPTVIDSESSGNQNNGIYGIVSFKMPGLALGLDHRIFLSGGVGLSPTVQNFRSGGNGGLVIAGLLPQRPFDTLGLGATYAMYNPDYYLPGLDNTSFTPGTEWAIEMNYSLNINQSVRIMPNLQFVLNPAGNNSRSTVFAAGIQIWYLF